VSRASGPGPGVGGRRSPAPGANQDTRGESEHADVALLAALDTAPKSHAYDLDVHHRDRVIIFDTTLRDAKSTSS
jgi:hypothetical protein